MLNIFQEKVYIFQLFQFQITPKSCHPTTVIIKGNTIQQIDESHYIAIHGNQIAVSST